MNNDGTTLLALVKKCLNIISTATFKDDEITLLINSAIADMQRLGIDFDITNALHESAVVQYVKGNFGMLDNATKDLCMRSYNLLVSSIQMNSDEMED